MTNALANLKPGDQVGAYHISAELNRGAMANAYAAQDARGAKVFLKQYKSPSAMVPWYEGYVAYQQELKRRIEGERLRPFCYRPVEFFQARKDGSICDHAEPHRRYFQVFEFVSGGKDLSQILSEIATKSSSHPWDRRLIWSKVILASVGALHAQGVVHADLKPENLILIPDESIAIKFRLKLIDMDYSVLTERRAPWHEFQGYAGTPGYFSPEHLREGAIPIPPSDVFTCALILGELLCGGRLIGESDDAPYGERALEGCIERLRLVAPIVDVAGRPLGNDARFLDLLYSALDPDPAKRPAARDLNAALNGAPAVPSEVKVAAPPSPRPVATPPAIAARPVPPPAPAPRPVAVPVPSGEVQLELHTSDGKSAKFRITSGLPQRLVRQFGEDAKFWDSDEQLRLERRPDGWYLVPNPKARNQTLLNAKACTAAARLATGDEIAVGDASKGIKKLPLTVKLA